MEPEVIAFLKRVALSIFIAFGWLAVNTVVGIRFNLAFVETSWTAGNVLFYIWLVGSFVLMLVYFVRMWKNTVKW